MPVVCSLAAVAISPSSVPTRLTDCIACAMRSRASRLCALPAATRSLDSSISCLISRAASVVRCASARTSEATTAKPRPDSPARAASTAALSARMLVWKATPSMVRMISAMRSDDCVICSIVSAEACTAAWLRSAMVAISAASCEPWLADAALCCTVPLICSIDAAVSSRLLACDSVRLDRSWLPAEISCTAELTLTISARTSATTVRMFSASWFSACCNSPATPRASTSTVCVRSPALRYSAPSSTRSSGRSSRRWMSAVAPTATPAAKAAATPTGKVAKAAPPRPSASACSANRRPRWPGVRADSTRPAQSRRTRRPRCSVSVRWPARASSRMRAYSAVADCTSSRVGAERTDR